MIPPWLAALPTPTAEERNRLSGHIVNWMRLSAVLGTLTHTELGQLFLMEVDGKHRPVILLRLMNRLLRLRRDADRAAMTSFLPTDLVNRINQLARQRGNYRSEHGR